MRVTLVPNRARDLARMASRDGCDWKEREAIESREGKAMFGEAAAEEGAVETIESRLLALVKSESGFGESAKREEEDALLCRSIAAELAMGGYAVESAELPLPRRSSCASSFCRMGSSGETGAGKEPSW